jgi:hypothetical protein
MKKFKSIPPVAPSIASTPSILPSFWAPPGPIVKVARLLYRVTFAVDNSAALLLLIENAGEGLFARAPIPNPPFSPDAIAKADLLVRSLEGARNWSAPHELTLARIKSPIPLLNEAAFVAAPTGETFCQQRLALVIDAIGDPTHVALAVLAGRSLAMLAGPLGYGIVVNRRDNLKGVPLLWGPP